MPLILEVSLARKIGLPDYGSLGASCGMKLEVDGAVIADPARLQEHLAQAYGVCAAAVEEELRDRQSAALAGASHHATSPSAVPPDKSFASRPLRGRITAKQLDYIHELASQIDSFSSSDLERLAQRMFAQGLERLSSLQASSLIQTLKQLKAGGMAVADVRPEVAA